MSDTDRSVSFNIDEKAVKQAEDRLESLQKEMKRLKLSFLSAGDGSEKASKELQRLAREEKKLVSAISEANQALGRQEDQVDQTTLALQRLEEAQERAQRTSGAVGVGGDIESSLLSLGGATSMLTGNQAIGQGIAGFAVGFEMLEVIPKLKENMKVLPTLIQTVSTSMGLSGLAGSLQQTIPALGATGASLGALAIAVLPLVAIGAALAVGMKVLGDAMAEAKRRAEENSELIKARIENEIELEELIRNNDYAEIMARREQMIEDVQRSEETLARMRAENNEHLKDDIAELETETIHTQQAIMQYGQALLNVNPELYQSAKNAELLEEIHSELNETFKEGQDILKQRQQALDKIGDLEMQIATMESDRAKNARRQAEQGSLEQQFENQDDIERMVEHFEELRAVRASGRERIKAIEESIVQMRVDQTKDLQKVLAKQQDKERELTDAYQEESLDRLTKYQKDMEKAESQQAKARLKLLQDITERLNDAQRSNNIIAFLQAQRDGEKQIREQSEQGKEQADERAKQFAEESRARREAFEDKLVEIRSELIKESAEIRKEYAKRQVEAVKQIEEEKKAIQQQREEVKKRYQEERAEQAEQDRRQRLREELTERYQNEDFEDRKNAIKELRDFEIQKIGELTTALQGVSREVENLRGREAMAQGRSPRRGLFSNLSRSFSGMGGAGVPFSGLFNRWNQSGGSSYNATFNTTVGDVASKADVERALSDYASADAMVWANTIDRLAYPTINGR